MDLRKLVESKLFVEWFEPDIIITKDNYKDYNLNDVLLPVMKHRDITFDPDAPEIEREFKYICDGLNSGDITEIEIKSVKNEHPYFYVYTKDGGVYDPGDIEYLVREYSESSSEPTERQKLNSLRKSNPEFDSKYNKLKAELKRMAGVARRHPGAPVEDARKELDDFLRDNGINPYKL